MNLHRVHERRTSNIFKKDQADQISTWALCRSRPDSIPIGREKVSLATAFLPVAGKAVSGFGCAVF